MRNLFFLLLVTAGVTPACKEKNETYAACCGAAPVGDVVAVAFCDSIDSPGRVYIPNLIVLSDDQNLEFERFFMLFANQCVLRVVSVEVTDPATGQVWFSRTNFHPNDPSFAWDGTRPDGTFHTGAFRYRFVVQFADGQEKTYTGNACAYRCGDADFPKEKLPECFTTGAQNGYGAADPTLQVKLDQCVE